MRSVISFIVPLFNAVGTLEPCVRSLMNQGLDNDAYEIILVNDGSTDQSEALCRILEKKHPAIRVVSQENKGPSEARNTGISAAKGDYLCFVDADDTLEPGGIASLLPYCHPEIDLVRFWCTLIHSGTPEDKTLANGQILYQGDGLGYLRKFGLETFCWCYLYRKSLVEENGLRFRPGIFGEDFAFMFDVMMAHPSMISVARRIYRYNILPGSISTTRSIGHSRKWVKDLSDTMIRISDTLSPFQKQDSALFERCHQSLDAKMAALFSRILSARYSTDEYRKLLCELRQGGVLPFSSPPAGKRETLIRFFLILIIKIPFLYPFACWCFHRLFLPYIYPGIDRNGSSSLRAPLT